MARKFAAVVFSLGCIHASSSFALGLGDLTLDSFLNEPLKAQVGLLNTGGLHADQIRVRLATREDFERMGVDRAYFLTNIQFEVSQNESGQAVIVMSSEDPVLEPYLDFIVEARWPTGRLLREYTVLVDPPLFDESTPVVSASQRVTEVEGIPPASDGKKKPLDPAATSGTRVDVKSKSNLAPGEMPERDFNAQAEGSPESGRRYMIHRDDTLWEIASAAKPVGTSVHQTMLDIQRLNPKAFIDGNINRIKAGYIIYLPQEDDISSSDLSEALAEVKQQNSDWEAGRASKPIATGPSLRISTDPVAQEPDGAGAGDHDPAASAAMEELEKSGLQQAEVSEQLASMEQQVETLQRIVNLKDDQIVALQNALAEAGGKELAADTMNDAEEGMPASDADTMLGEATDSAMDEMAGESLAGEAASEELAPVAEEIVEEAPATVKAEPVVAPAKAKPAPKPAPAEGGMMSYLFYGLGALVLALLAFVFVRRGKGEDEAEATAVVPVSAASDDAFSAVELKEQQVEAMPELEEPDPVEAEEPEADHRDNRGYGEHKHDEYASDDEAGDALAEADIYIAYGRYPQAIDLLRNAISSEPANAAYRLKLLEMFLQTGDRSAAENELRELEAIGEQDSLDRANALMNSTGGTTDDLSAPPAGLAEEMNDALETDFAGLQIEDGLAAGDSLDDLDLSADFSEGGLSEDEDLVIAAEANGMSTKLDLARAYLDMGDEDGARQILEEVMAEGSGEQQAEAGELLERIG